jgi:hypothetical protein
MEMAEKSIVAKALRRAERKFSSCSLRVSQ